jgi:hypothetical protein
MTWGPNSSQATMWPNLKQTSLNNIAEMRRRSPWMTHKKPEAWAAMVMSDCTRNMYGRDPNKLEDKYMSNVLGFFRTGLEEHMPITVIEDWNLNTKDLSDYKVLILPNTACLSDEQAKAVEEFVKNGGGLVATTDASLFDELGNQRKDFALSKVFGVTYKGIPRTDVKKEELDINFVIGLGNVYWEKRKSIYDMDIPMDSILQSDRLKSYMAPGQKLCFKGQANYVELIDGKASSTTLGTLTARADGAKPFPAYFTNTYGKGKVVYFGAGVDSAYYLYPYPYQRLLMAQAVRWVAPEVQPITVEAPMCIHSTFYRQEKDGKRLVVQLFNDLNTSGNHAKPDEDIPLHEEIVPVHDIKVAFKGYGISRVHLEPEGIDLTVTKNGDTSQVTVPKIEIHSMVVAELQ